MRNQLLACFIWAAANVAMAQPAAGRDTTQPLEPGRKEPAPRNHFSLSYRLGLNITADFNRLGGFPALTDPGADTGSAVDRNYDDGYNRVDSSGNAGGLTWYWGYENPSSVQGDTIVLHSASSQATGTSKNNDDGVNHGLEISYRREFGHEPKWRWGLEAAFGFTLLAVEDSRTLRNEVDLITDTFQVPGGVFVIPAAPYHGTYEGPGPVMDSSLDPGQRVRTVITQGATITGQRKLEADIYLIRLGPYVEFPLTEKLSFFLNGGLNLVIGATEFSFTETVVYDGGTRAVRADSGSQTDFLVGGYVGGGLDYAFNREWSVFAGAQYQTAGRSFNNQGGKQSVLDMGETIVVTVGLSYHW